MQVQLNISNFCTYFAFDPTSRRLSPRDQTIAKVTTIALTIFTLGLFHCVASLFYSPPPLHDLRFLGPPFERGKYYHEKGDYQKAVKFFLSEAQNPNGYYRPLAFARLENHRSLYEALEGGHELYATTLPQLKAAYEAEIAARDEADRQHEIVARRQRIEAFEANPSYDPRLIYQASQDYHEEGLFFNALALAIQGADQSDLDWAIGFCQLLRAREAIYRPLKGVENLYAKKLPRLERLYEKRQKARYEQKCRVWDIHFKHPNLINSKTIFLTHVASDYALAGRLDRAFEIYQAALHQKNEWAVLNAILHLELAFEKFKDFPGAKELYEKTLPELKVRLKEQSKVKTSKNSLFSLDFIPRFC